MISHPRANRRTASAVLVLVAPIWVSGCSSAPERDSTPEPSPNSPPITLVGGSEVTSSQTLKDWAANSDYVVVADVVDERRLPIPVSETSDPKDELVPREVSVVVESVVWRANDTPEPSPTAFTMSAFGWRQTDAGLAEIVAAGSSRLEVGHTYVLALARMRATCSVGDKPSPSQWVVIGSGGAIPADDGTLGHGEYEGITTTPSDLDGVRGEYAGSSLSLLDHDLRQSHPTRTHAFREIGDPCP